MNVLLVGEESAGIQALRALVSGPHRVVGVLASPSGTGTGTASLSDAAERLGLPVWPARSVRDAGFAREVRSRSTDVLLNVHSLHVVHEAVLAAPRIGSFNLHPGPLPRYAGRNAVSWALYRGEASHGVTLHWMEPEIDAGPIAYQATFPVGTDDTALSVFRRCVGEGLPLIGRLLEAAAAGTGRIPRVPQDRSRREYFGHGAPDGGRLRWSRPARDIVNFVRACDFRPFPSPWGHPRATLGRRDVAVVRIRRTGRPADAPPGTVGEAEGPGCLVACADEWVLVGTVAVDGASLDAGRVLAPGDRLGDGA